MTCHPDTQERTSNVRAVVIAEHGGPEVLTVSEIDEPEPGPGRVLAEVAAAGVNFIDVYHREGAYPMPLPFVLGREGAGRVVALGEGVTEVAVGDLVAWSGAPSYAERAVVPAAGLVPVPDGVSAETAAGCLLQGMTAHYLLHSTYPVQAGDAVLVHAAAGGMGLLLTQWATALGARVIGTVSTPEKERLARAAGAAEIIRYTEVDDLAAAVRELVGEGVAAVYDGVGATTFDAGLASLRPRGMLALFGSSSGPVPPVDPQRLNAAGSVFLTRPSLAHHTATRDELTWRAAEVFDAVAKGTLNITVGARYPLADVRRSHEDLQARRTTGKLLLIP
jgi:NADPH2:quinone reductase